MCDLKIAQLNLLCSLIYKFELGQMLWKQPKTFVVQKVNVQFITVQ